jgi:hypothetical protein
MRKNGKSPLKYVFLLIVFIVGITTGLCLWDSIVLPFHNPWDVLGNLTVIQFNPLNNIARFIILVWAPSLLLLLFYFFHTKNNSWILERSSFRGFSSISTKSPARGRGWFAVILVLFSLIIGLNIVGSRTFDSFHDGESLGTGISYLAGGVPYRDFIFCHGVFQDPMRSTFAFAVFGKSIGAFKTLESITKLLSFVLLIVFLLQNFKSNYVFIFISVILLFLVKVGFFLSVFIPEIPQSFTTINTSRDITLYAFLITIPIVQSAINNQKISSAKLIITLFFFSFIPLASFGYSIDRGFYLFAAYLIISPFVYILFFHRSAYRVHFLLSSFTGLLVALGVLSLIFQGEFKHFFEYTFLIMPKYKELLDGKVYPIFNPRYLAICVLIAANTFWLVYKFIQELHLNSNQVVLSLKLFSQKHFCEICLLILSILFFRSALGRADWGHVLYSSHLTYILSISILFKNYFYNYATKKWLMYTTAVGVLVVSSFYIFRAHQNKLISVAFPLKSVDADFIPTNYSSTISYLKNNLGREDDFLTMTSEASWYYFIDKPCPTRFPVLWFASPYFYQEEVIEDLENKNVKFVLYRNNLSSNAIDGFDNEERFPVIISYLKQNYSFHTKIDDNEIWISNKHL